VMSTDPGLLDIAQAAALLQVSEASLRRWTNRGLLPCLRIGGRRERRFRRADLLAFVERPPEATPTGHLCSLYTSDIGRTRVAARLLGSALDDGSACILAAQPDVREKILSHLARRRRSLRRVLETGRLTVTDYAGSVTAQLAYWKTGFERATRNGARSIHVVGDGSGARLAKQGEGDFAALLEYEAAYGRLARRFPVSTVCLYDARVHTGLETAAVLALHPDLFRQPVAHLVS